MALIPLPQQEQAPDLLPSGGIRTLQTPNLPGPSTAWGQAFGNVGNVLGQMHQKMVEATDTRHLIEAEGSMRGAMAAQLEFQRQNPEEKDWLPNWQKTIKTLDEQNAKLPLSDQARLRLKSSFGRFADNQSAEIQGMAFKQAVNRSNTAVITRATEAAKLGNDDEIRAAFAMQPDNHMWPEEKQARIAQLLDVSKRARWEKATTIAETTVRGGGSLEDAKAIIQGSDMPSYLKESALVNTERLHKQVTETKTNEDQAKFLGYVMLERAKGTEFVPAQVESWVKEGKLDAATGARVYEAVKQKVGSNPGEFERFITNKVMTYDRDADPTKKQFQELQGEALALGLNKEQSDRYDMLMQQALSGRKPEDKALNYLKAAPREMIGRWDAEGKLGIPWKKSAGDITSNIKLLQQPFALEHWGIDTAAAGKIRELSKIDPQQALDMFREASNARTRVGKDGKVVSSINTEKLADGSDKFGISKLSPWTVKALDDLSKSNKAGEVIDEDARMKSGTRAAELMGLVEHDIDSFKETNKRLPKAEEVNGIVNKYLTPLLHQGAVDVFEGKTPPPAAPAGSGDLSARLPDNLKPYADTFEAAGRIYGINPAFLAAVSAHETAGGTSHAFREKKNAMGISNNAGPIAFDDPRDSILQQARALAGKTYHGANDIPSIGRIYAPPGAGNDPHNDNPSWPAGVSRLFREFAGSDSAPIRVQLR